MGPEDSYELDRQRMVEIQIVRRGIKDARVIEAMRAVPRHLFVPPEYRHLAYTDGPLPIGKDQTISQPYIVALMSELLRLEGHERVLEVGTGSGYQAAILGHLAVEVHTIERHNNLAQNATQALDSLGLKNVHVHIGDGTQGLKAFAPYHAIIVTAAAPSAPRPLLEQLINGGLLVIPVGGLGAQYLERWSRLPEGHKQETIIPVAFVPLIGEHGWDQ